MAPLKPDQEKEPSPYTSFKDDRHRLLALISRDIRFVLVTLIMALAGVPLSRFAVSLFTG